MNGKYDVLLIEDNPHDAELTVRGFNKSCPQYKVLVIDDGIEALDYLFCRNKYADRDKANLPRIVLVDMKLPKMQGLDILERVQNEERLENLPFIVLSSSSEISDINKAYALGARSYVVKPMDYDHYMDTIGILCQFWLTINQYPQK